MKKIKGLIFTVIVVLSIGFISCESEDTSSTPPPDPYVTFTGTTYSSGGNWESGYSDAAYNSKPCCSYVQSPDYSFYGMGSQTSVTASSFDNDTINHLYFVLPDYEVNTYSQASVVVQIRLSSINSGNSFQLTDESVTITHSDSNYIEGTFTGKDFAGNTVSGSFVLNNVGQNNWPEMN